MRGCILKFFFKKQLFYLNSSRLVFSVPDKLSYEIFNKNLFWAHFYKKIVFLFTYPEANKIITFIIIYVYWLNLRISELLCPEQFKQYLWLKQQKYIEKFGYKH